MPLAKLIHGWKTDEGKFALSLQPRDAAGPRNLYDTPTAALQESSRRGLPIAWENAADIDGPVNGPDVRA